MASPKPATVLANKTDLNDIWFVPYMRDPGLPQQLRARRLGLDQ
jgi:hypothetical protein